jgi:hypothetical protein
LPSRSKDTEHTHGHRHKRAGASGR